MSSPRITAGETGKGTEETESTESTRGKAFDKDADDGHADEIDESKENSVIKSINFLKNKAKTLEDIYQNSQYILKDNIQISSEDLKLLDDTSKKIIKEFLIQFENLSRVDKESLEKIINVLISKHKTNFKGIGQPLRIVLTGSKFGPGIYNIIISLDKSEVIKRLKVFN